MPRAHRRCRLALGATLLAGAVALSACDGGSDPTVSTAPTLASTTAPTTSTSSAPPTTATAPPSYVPIAPTYPSVSKKRTRAGAEAFVRYYFDAVNYAWTKPDASILAGLGEDTCNSCKTLAETAKEMSERSERYTSQTARVENIEYALGDSSSMRFVVDIHQLKSERVSSSGKVLESDKEKELKRIVGVKWGVDRWRISLIGAG